MNSFVIREAIDADHKFIVDFQLRMADETENMKLDKETVMKGVSEILKNSWRGYYLVAENDAQPVGVILVLSEWSDWRNGEVLWIHSLYVASGYRKQGVFKSFYRHLQEKVQANDQYRGIRLYVDKTNITAQKTYAAIGMSNEHYDLFEWMK